MSPPPKAVSEGKSAVPPRTSKKTAPPEPPGEQALSGHLEQDLLGLLRRRFLPGSLRGQALPGQATLSTQTYEYAFGYTWPEILECM